MAKHIEKYSTAGDYGLKTLADPADLATTDIVFVHGLTGNRESTWTDPESKTFWPLALLPSDVPTARILAFGYEADILHAFDVTSPLTLAHHADVLAKSLARARSSSNAPNRPLIFVAHSVGGLLVEQALLHCRESSDPAESAVLEATAAIAYIGTPHAGADLGRWQRTLTYLAKMLHRTDEHVQHVLVPGAKLMVQVEDEFATMLEARAHAGKRPVAIVCFYEALGVAGIGLVVPWHSAVLANSPHKSIHADHVGIARFGSKENAGYKAISSQLEAWVDEFVRV